MAREKTVWTVIKEKGGKMYACPEVYSDFDKAVEAILQYVVDKFSMDYSEREIEKLEAELESNSKLSINGYIFSIYDCEMNYIPLVSGN